MKNPIAGKYYRIPGFSNYAVSPEGKIVHFWKTCTRDIQPILKKKCKGSQYLYVHIVDDEGKRRNVKISDIVWKTFRGNKNGMVLYHKNGIITDNDIQNLAITDKKSLGEKTGANASRKTVARISRDGDVIEFFRSARDAGRKTNMSYQTVIDRCHGKVKNEFALDGTTFRYMDNEKKVEKFCQILKDSNVRSVGDAIPESMWEW